MTIRVEIAGKGMVAEFPDGTDPSVIDAAIKRDYFSGAASAPPAPEPVPMPAIEGASPWEAGDVPTVKEVAGAVSPAVRPMLETGGLLAGGVYGGVPGAALGYGMGKGTADLLDEYAGVKPIPSLPEKFLSSAKDVATGATMEMGGQVAGKVIGKGMEVGGKVGKQVLGRLTGAGPGAASEAVKGGEAFTDAMRGKISGEEIVQNAKEALGVIKDNRAATYQTQLQALPAGQEINIAPIQLKFSELLKRYGVRIEQDGSLNMTRTALGKSGNKDVEEIIGVIRGWGNQPGDKTATGLDTLKRQLDDFYSESSNARAFVASLRNTVKDTIVKDVPEYATMTKDYAEATSLIKDIESGLMLRKQGMSGRVVADQTLRRLMSSMRDNLQLRKELLGVLGNQGGQDLSGQVAGYSMNAYLPIGLAGVAPSMAGTAAMLKYINPKFLPLLVASSPRVSGEFLRMLGKGAMQVPGASMAAGKAAAYLTVPPAASALEGAYSGN